VVGAGPAGLSCASTVEGRVLLLEREKTPYENISCAEWIPPFLDIPCIQKTEGMLTIYPGGEKFSPVKGKVIDRKAWQKNWLSSLKCDVHTGEKVLYVKNGRVRTEKGEYRTEWICIASGPGRAIRGLIPQKEHLSAVNMRFKLVKPLEYTIVWFTEEIKHGYAWCFPRGEMVNVGLGMRGRISSMIPRVIEFFKKRGVIKGDPIRITGGLIPQEEPHPFEEKKILFVGDAGGFTDPLTGAGILSAIDTGRLAGKLVTGSIRMEDYRKELSKAYIPFIRRRKKRKEDMEEQWDYLKRTVERYWISIFPE